MLSYLMMKNLMLSLGRAVVNLVYPLRCQICRKKLVENNGLCEDCISRIQVNEFGKAACRYDGILKEALHIFKYNGVLSLSKAFSRIMLQFVDKNIDMKDIDMIVPMPLHTVRLRERGFNQAYLLSIPIARRYNIPIYTGHLVKRRATAPQSSLNKSQRLKNLDGVFSIRKKEELKGRRLLLVDDVYTTGATINNASKVLKKAGAKSVRWLTLARGS